MLVLSALELDQEGRVFSDRNQDLTIAIRVPVGAERHEVLASLVEQVARIGDIFAPLAVQANNSVPPPDDASETVGP